MSALSPDLLLQPAPGLQLRWEADGTLELTLRDGRRLSAGAQALAVLAAFRHPQTVRTGMDRLRAEAASPAAWAELAGALHFLWDSEALVSPNGKTAGLRAGAPDFGAASIHISMLNDRVRTQALLDAIAAVVKPGDVVVEIGTGTGVLAVAAARAGARHVYAIEAGAMAGAAREMICANGVADRVTIVDGWSTSVTLPERGDVLVTETIGNAAFDENIVALTRDALSRHLRPGARVIPQELRLLALPVQAPAEWLARQRFQPSQAEAWREWYALDFSALAAFPELCAAPTRLVYPAGDSWPVLGPPVVLASARFGDGVATSSSSTNLVTFDASGELNAFALYLEAELAPGILLTTDPRLPRAVCPSNWGNPVWFVPATPVTPERKMTLHFGWNERPPHQWEISDPA